MGGSPEPILHAVRSHGPDEVIFVCSSPPCPAASEVQVTGEGNPCSHRREDGSIETRPNLVHQLEIKDFRPHLQLLRLPDPDNLADCHRRIRGFCHGLRQRFSSCHLIADYSGGTKTMSAALAMAMIEQEGQLTVVRGVRSNLQRIDQSRGVLPVPVSALQAGRLLRERLPAFLEDHRYDRALEAVQEFMARQGAELEPARAEAARRLQRLLQALVRWDRYQWQQALGLARQVGLDGEAELAGLRAWWERVVAAHQCLAKAAPLPPGTSGYELVQDLLLSAGRRGRRGWFDDAVARLYRALELLLQTYIQLELRIDHRHFWRDPDVKEASSRLGLSKGLDGLSRWLQDEEGDAGLGGALKRRQWRRFRKLLDKRNRSLLAHGLQPVDEGTWRSLQEGITDLVGATLTDLHIQQGPSPRQLPGTSLLQLPSIQILMA